MKHVIVITGASSGFGLMSARALAHAGHTVYASMRETTGRNASRVEELRQYASEHSIDLRTIELDVGSQASADAGIAKIIADCGRLDVVIHNAGHMVFGPAEACQLATGGDLKARKRARGSTDHPRCCRRVDDSAGPQLQLGARVHDRRSLTCPNGLLIHRSPGLLRGTATRISRALSGVDDRQLNETLNDRDSGTVGASPHGKCAPEVIHLSVAGEH